ncbi:MAG: aminoglycoside phosphotransferase family protein [Pseudomonadota bacterium]
MLSPDSTLTTFLVASGLARAEEEAKWTSLTGGVSSDIWRVQTATRDICIKRALPKLKVDAEWQAPVSRNAVEWDWYVFAAEHAPAAVPTPLAHDPEAGLFAMEFLVPEQYPLWKAQLLMGEINVGTAAAVGRVLVQLHNASAVDSSVPARFDTTINFHALRLEPYLIATAVRHPALRVRLEEILQTTASTRRALVHGDVSPKNILVGPESPVLLDAECAWFGDPAFDLAFCANHLLLKCLVCPSRREQLLVAFDSLVHEYLDKVEWEPRPTLEARATALLPALLLARVDGKSPVEYLTDERQKALVRSFAIPLIEVPEISLSAVRSAWARVLKQHISK